jgi:hypothetical protein
VLACSDLRIGEALMSEALLISGLHDLRRDRRGC